MLIKEELVCNAAYFERGGIMSCMNYVSIYTCMVIRKCVCVHMCACMHACIYIYGILHIYICYIHACMHTCNIIIVRASDQRVHIEFELVSPEHHQHQKGIRASTSKKKPDSCSTGDLLNWSSSFISSSE